MLTVRQVKKTKELEGMVKVLQDEEEHRQRRERKNNIIIKSNEFDKDMGTTLVDKTKEILRRIETKDEFIKATYIGKNKTEKGIVRVELNSLVDKITVMRNKSKLKGQDCFIDADMTKTEREIQQILRKEKKATQSKLGTKNE